MPYDVTLLWQLMGNWTVHLSQDASNCVTPSNFILILKFKHRPRAKINLTLQIASTRLNNFSTKNHFYITFSMLSETYDLRLLCHTAPSSDCIFCLPRPIPLLAALMSDAAFTPITLTRPRFKPLEITPLVR